AMDALEVLTVTINGVAPTAGGTITNTATVAVASPGIDSDPNNNSSSVATTVNPPQADLAVFKGGPSTVAPGDPISWTITVSNLGPQTATTVSVVDTLPSSVVFGSATAPSGWSCVESSGVVTCSTASMAASTTATIGITGTAPSTKGTITNGVSITSGTGDPATGNNNSSKSTLVDELCPSGAPVPASPAYGSTESDTEVTFSWKAVAGAIGYQVVLLPDDGPAEVIGTHNGSAPSGQTLSLVGLARPGLNIWVVQALFADNCPSTTSVQFRFFVRSCPSGAPVLISPLDGVTTDSPVIFRWTGVSGAIRYELHASINSSPFTVIASIDSDQLPADPVRSCGLRRRMLPADSFSGRRSHLGQTV
ncbi:MAG: DUF11 domain-containing protein, partial [Acidobacteria bacterium]|nr:DUF11 domain-containing protein [Acidobacteriota bacterium]